MVEFMQLYLIDKSIQVLVSKIIVIYGKFLNQKVIYGKILKLIITITI